MSPNISIAAALCLLLANINSVVASENEVNPRIRDVVSAEMSDRDCLVYNLYHEARGESDLANIMVLNTVFNRVSSPNYPNTICGVVKQPYQYSWTNDGRSDVMRNLVQVDRLTKLIDMYLVNKDAYLALSKGADHYHTTAISPYWSKSDRMEAIAVVDNHIFYRRKEL